MKATILVAEAGTFHPDGTFSLLRAGIDRVWAEQPPAVFQGVVAIRFRAEPSERGKHKCVLTAVDTDGKRVAPDLQGEFDVPEHGGNGLFIVGFKMEFPQFGDYEFSMSIDGIVREEWPFRVVEKKGK